jgi:hypothetical protein
MPDIAAYFVFAHHSSNRRELAQDERYSSRHKGDNYSRQTELVGGLPLQELENSHTYCKRNKPHQPSDLQFPLGFCNGNKAVRKPSNRAAQLATHLSDSLHCVYPSAVAMHLSLHCFLWYRSRES